MAEPDRLTPNQRNRRARILAATRDLVGKHGYGGMIMRDVADQAGVSPTTLYNLYNTKDELLLTALRDQLTATWDGTSNAAGGPGYAYLLQTLAHAVAQTRDAPAYANAIVQALLRANAGDELVDVLLRGTRNPVHTSLFAMAERGELEPATNIEALSTMLIGAFWSGYLLWSKGVIELSGLEDFLKRSYLSALLPVSRGKARRELEACYAALDE